MSTNAPIALFIFNRPRHLRNTLAALAKCQGFAGAPIFVFADGPRRPDDVSTVEAARAAAKDLLGDHAVYRFSDTNKGLARSIIDGVSAVLREYDRVIVLEDDLDLAPGFLTYMNAALDRYAAEDQVYQISGHAFDAPELAARTTAAFLPFIGTWGWATWRRAWKQMDETASGWEAIKKHPELRRRFNLGGVYDYATMLERQMQGKRDSWGIRWYWSVFAHDGLVLYPPRTLVRNEGFDGSGSHGRGALRRYGDARQSFHEGAIELPAPVLDAAAFAAVRRAIARQNGGAAGMLADMVKKLAGRVLSR